MKKQFWNIAYGALAGISLLAVVGQKASAQSTDPEQPAPASVTEPAAPVAEVGESEDGQGASFESKEGERRRQVKVEVQTDPVESFMDALIPLAGIGAVFGMPALIAVLALYFAFRRSKMRHETLLALADRGVDITKVDLLEPSEKKDKSPLNDLRTGLILVGSGLGISIMLYVLGIEHVAGVGAIPGLIGLAYLCVYAVRRKGAPAE